MYIALSLFFCLSYSFGLSLSFSPFQACSQSRRLPLDGKSLMREPLPLL